MRPQIITRDRIAQWAREASAAIDLPELVRRLIQESNPAARIDGRTGTGVWRGGLDLHVVAGARVDLFPAGASVWELSKSATPFKRDRDFAKRSKRAHDFPGVDPAVTTYVSVTAGVVDKKRSWAEAKTKEGPWARVELLDADDLALWLSQAPVTTRWFADDLGFGADGLRTLDSFLAQWRAATKPAIPNELLLAGHERKLAAERVREWAASREARPLFVRAASVQEAAAFAAMALSPGDTGAEPWHARSLVVETAASYAWARAGAMGRSLFVLPTFSGFDPTELPDPASAVRVIVPLVAPSTLKPDIVLDRVRPKDLFELWAAREDAPDDLLRLVSQSAGDIASLRLLLGTPTQPAWAVRPSRELLVILLLGSWIATDDGDRAVASQLGADWQTLDTLCRSLSTGPEAPLLETHGDHGARFLTWRAPGAAWALLTPVLADHEARGFCEIARGLLAQRAATRGPVGDEPTTDEPPPASGVLLRGVAETLARLALLRERSSVAACARSVVYDVLVPGWEGWAALSDLLPVLAEAAPHEFLERVSESLRAGDQGVSQLLAQERRWGSSPHTHLLWALETLAWDERLLRQTALALAALASRGTDASKPGKVANRPFASLGRALDLELGETNADRGRQVAVLEAILAGEPDVGYSLLLDQFPQYLDGFRLTQNRFAVINDQLQAAAWRSRKADGSPAAELVVRMAVTAAATDPLRWASLLHHSHALPPGAESIIVDGLEAVLPGIDDANGAVLNALRGWLAWDARRADKRPGHRLATRRAIYEQMLPNEWFGRYGWLFGARVELLDGTGDFYADQAILERLRLAALEELGGATERWELLARLDAVPGAHALGELLTKVSFRAEIESALLEERPAVDLRGLACSFAAARALAEPMGWVHTLALRWLDANRTDDAVALLLRLPAVPERWTQIDDLPDPLRAGYWASLEHFTVEDPAAATHALRRLLDNGNTVLALRLAGHLAPVLQSDILLEVLERNGAALAKALDGEGAVMVAHYVDRTLGVLAKREGLDRVRAAEAEQLFLRVLGPLHHPRVS